MELPEKPSLAILQKLCINVLKCGPIPKHIAFIMDGNRRYARRNHLENIEGHKMGFEKLWRCLGWCHSFGIKEVTVYAFSIENFARSEEEVAGLMQLAREQLNKLLKDTKKLHSKGVCMRFLGNLSLLPDDLKKLIAKVSLLTSKNTKQVINVAFSYTSTEEITNSIKSVVQGVYDKELALEDITEDLLTKCLYTNKSSNPNILVRTSGEIRLSDFLLWQSSNTLIYFTKVLWPEFSFWQLSAVVFKYQRCYRDIQEVQKERKELTKERNEPFLEKLQQKRVMQLKAYAKGEHV